jgi:hypothetical protein
MAMWQNSCLLSHVPLLRDEKPIALCLLLLVERRGKPQLSELAIRRLMYFRDLCPLVRV